MLKFLTIVLTLCCIVQVQSCSKSKPTQVSSCPEHEYMKHSTRSVLSKHPGNLKMGQLSLPGTRQSLSKGLDPNLTTQELSIEDQMEYGVRAFEISVSPLFNVFRLHVGTIYLNITFGNVLKAFDDFLEKNPLEFFILILNDDGIVRFDETKCDNRCDAFAHYANDDEFGWRLVTKWSLDDNIGRHRGKILLATNSRRFQNDVFDLNDKCLTLESQVSSVGEKDHVKSTLEYKWNKYVELTKNSEHARYPCFFYDLGVNDHTSSIRKISKYGGYYYKKQCVEPMNYRFSNYHSEIRSLSMRIILFDCITQEAIDHVNSATVSFT